MAKKTYTVILTEAGGEITCEHVQAKGVSQAAFLAGQRLYSEDYEDMMVFEGEHYDKLPDRD